MKSFCLAAIATFFSLFLFSQEKVSIYFPEKSHDFGIVYEEGGIVAYNFNFTNQSSQAIRIEHIQTTCGCTTPVITDSVIAAGQQGTIKLAYDPKYRPGIFNRQAYVHYSSENKEYVDTLHINGEVQPRPMTIDERFPYEIGKLQCNCKMMYYKYAFMGQKHTLRLNCYNHSSTPQTMALTTNKCVSVSGAQTIEPDKIGSFDITYDTEKGNYGINMSKLHILVNGDTIPAMINVRAEVKEDFTNLTEKQQKKAPIIRCVVENKKGVTKGDMLTMNVTIENDGLSPLLIRRVDTNGNFITANLAKSKIGAGKHTTLRLDVDTRNIELGDYRRKIVIIANDPTQPEISVYIDFVVYAAQGN